MNDKVLLKNFRRKHGMGTVEQQRYKGPYMIKTCCGKGNYLLNDLDTGKELGPYNQKSLKVWSEPHSNNVNALSTDEVDENNNDKTFGQDRADDANSSITNENSGSGRDRISVEAVVHTANIEKSGSEYPPSTQSAFTSLSAISFDLFNVSPSEIFIFNVNHEPEDEI